MLNHEINNYLSTKDFHLTKYELKSLCKHSPQICCAELEKHGEVYSRYHIATYDNVNWIVFIKN